MAPTGEPCIGKSKATLFRILTITTRTTPASSKYDFFHATDFQKMDTKLWLMAFSVPIGLTRTIFNAIKAKEPSCKFLQWTFSATFSDRVPMNLSVNSWWQRISCKTMYWIPNLQYRRRIISSNYSKVRFEVFVGNRTTLRFKLSHTTNSRGGINNFSWWQKNLM